MLDAWSPVGWEHEKCHASCRAQGEHLPPIPRLLAAAGFPWHLWLYPSYHLFSCARSPSYLNVLDGYHVGI